MTGLLRIRARSIQRTWSDANVPFLNGRLPSWPDVEVFVVAPDGTETPFTGVRSVTFTAREGSEPLTATLECLVDELDVEAELVVP